MADQNGDGIGVDGLLRRFDSRAAPLVFDIRWVAAFKDADRLLAGCLHREAGEVHAWSATPPAEKEIVVYGVPAAALRGSLMFHVSRSRPGTRKCPAGAAA